VAGVLAVTLHLTSRHTGLPAPVAQNSRGYQRPGGGELPVARSAPVRLTIPAISLTTRVVRLGLNRDSTIQLPAWHVAGWYKLGPSPGQQGSAVIIGHVDNYQGPAVFFKLRLLRPGNRILVRLADGVTVRFAVLRVAMYPKTRFPTQLVYGSRGYNALQLVTCGGVFDSATGSYLSNVVVYTYLLGAKTR
jgi:sortase (surface protein transpeptidase)